MLSGICRRNGSLTIEPLLAQLSDPSFEIVNQGSAIELAAAVLAPPRAHGGTILQRHIGHLLGASGQRPALASRTYQSGFGLFYDPRAFAIEHTKDRNASSKIALDFAWDCQAENGFDLSVTSNAPAARKKDGMRSKGYRPSITTFSCRARRLISLLTYSAARPSPT